MTDINQVTMGGRLTRDCEQKEIGQNTMVTFTVATNRSYKRGDEWVNEASFVDVKWFGNMARFMAPFLVKGEKVIVSGSLRQESWEAKDGTKKSKLVVYADKCEVCASIKADSKGKGPEPFNEDIPEGIF